MKFFKFMKPWKFNLGDIVTAKVQEDYGHAQRMLVFSRVTEETADGIFRRYVVTHYKSGDMVRSTVAEEEIALLPEKP